MSDLWQQLDLTRDTVVEASAGTGKTYTIEHLVGRLLLERELGIDQILLVTFTEKATGEMKQRIRAYLELLLVEEQSPPLDEAARVHLARELERFDEAAITTIHGFCQRVLTEFAFENGQVGRQELGDTGALGRSLLRGIMRTEWVAWATEHGLTVEQMLLREDAKATPVNIHDHVLALLDRWRHDADHFPDAWHAPADGAAPSGSLVARTAELLYQRLEREKERQAIYTFDDMIARVARAVTSTEVAGEQLVQILRSRYRVALVDEFQDTDPEQWSIFQRLFQQSPEHTLMVVGDPKQAIYRFRGADLNTYLAARAVVGHTETLDTNHRSTAPLMDAFNQLFSHPNWFGSGASGYQAVQAGSQSRLALASDIAYAQSPVVAVELTNAGETTAPPAIARMADFTAREIAACLSNPDRLRPARAEEAPLCENDFCILVRTRADASHYENALRRRNIAYSFYKKGGVYQSDEARHLQRVLAMLTQPDNETVRALAEATRFFTLDIARGQHAHATEHELRLQLEAWLQACDERDWSRLFRAMLYESGLLYREARRSDGERRLANYLQITEELEEAALQQGLDIKGIHDLLTQQVMQQVEVDEEADRHRLETERASVKIMTMHVSKGLQFPVVFVGSTSKKAMGNHVKVYTFTDGDQRTISIDPDDKPRAWAEEQSEQKRLFYVAMTRAEFRLFMPFGAYEKGKARTPAPLDPLTHDVLAQTIAHSPSTCTKIHHLTVQQISSPTSNIEHPTSNIQQLSIPTTNSQQPTTNNSPSLHLPDPNLIRRQRQVDSFTRLSRHRSHPRDEGERLLEKGADEASGATPARSHLPAGFRSGNAFHDVMEALCAHGGLGGFACVQPWDTPSDILAQPAFSAMIEDSLAANGIRPEPRDGVDLAAYGYRSAREEMARMVWDTLHAPLKTATGKRFTLSELTPASCRAEMEFYATESEAMLGVDDQIEAQRRGLLNGFIDLLFEYEGLLYILDWKTNTLDDYAPAGLEQAMQAADYKLQYRIYGLAVMRWLEKRGQDPDLLGGAYYLFARGLNHPESHGIYTDVTATGRRDHWRAIVSARLRRPSKKQEGEA